MLAPSPGFVVGTLIAIVFMVVYPLVVAARAHHTLGVGWRYFAYGMVVFLLAQIMTRLPALQLLQGPLGGIIRSSDATRFGWLVVTALTAGLVEEGGRYIGYRYFMGNEEKTWSKGVMFGLGHGGLESMLLTAGLLILSLVNYLRLVTGGPEQIPEAQRGVILQQMQAFEALSWLNPAFAAWERLWTLPLQVAFSVIVLQVFRQRRIQWLWIAIAAHTLVNLLVTSAPLLFGGGTRVRVATELLVALLGLAALWVIGRMRTLPALPQRGT